MSDDRRVPITLRMPRDLLDRLKAAGEERSHSMNAEIVNRLEASFEPRNVEEAIDPHIPLASVDIARVNLAIAIERLEHAEELEKYIESDRTVESVDKAVAKFNVLSARSAVERAERKLREAQILSGGD